MKFVNLLKRVRQRAAQITGGAPPVNFRTRDPEEIDADVTYAIGNAQSYHAFVAEGRSDVGVAGVTVLEIGPGINFAPMLALAGEGAKAIVADRFLAPWDPGYHPEFHRRFLSAWGKPNSAFEAVICAGNYPPEVITLVQEPTEHLTSIADQSVDFVISNAVMEHVFDLEAAAHEFARITKPNGRHSHQVDFRDHRNFDQPLEFLLLEDGQFAQLFKRTSGETGNRRRAGDMRSVFEQSGFLVEDMQVTETAKPDYMASFVPRLRRANSRFKDLDEQELMRLSARFFLRRAA